MIEIALKSFRTEELKFANLKMTNTYLIFRRRFVANISAKET